MGKNQISGHFQAGLSVMRAESGKRSKAGSRWTAVSRKIKAVVAISQGMAFRSNRVMIMTAATAPTMPTVWP